MFRWEALFEQAFGYRISPKLLLPNYENGGFFTAYSQGSPIGTCLLHTSGKEVVGIHAVGILPERRSQGLAQQLMHLVLNQSLEQGFAYATLQASTMGKGLYVKLGFQADFLLINYALPLSV